MMKKIDVHDPETQAPDLVAENIDRLKELFPEAWREGKVDFEILKQLLGGVVDEREEKYGLNWHGKRQARQLALTPSTGTLRPAPEQSVGWERTQNLMIEGDNLEVLKLFQKSYAGMVKLIYIDPPYNTGKDFIYPDDYRDSIANYLRITGQTANDGAPTSTNAETSGRFHTNWLNMVYPRLKLARNLLRTDGSIFISIDDAEVSNLRTVLDEVFGPENFLAQIVWEKMYTTKNDSSAISTSHDYILCYAKDASISDIGLLPRTEAMDARYSNPDNDPRGEWKAIPLYADGERRNGRFTIASPTGRTHVPPPNCHWRYIEADVIRLIADNRIWFGRSGDGLPNLKRFLSELKDGVKAKTLWTHKEVGSNDTASREIKELFDGDAPPFSFPKPTGLIRRMLQIAAADVGSIVLDFFGGSGTTADAVMQQNAADGAARRFILVQLPEPLDSTDKEQREGADYCDRIGVPRTIAELTKIRLRRSGQLVREKNPMFGGDTGFRVYKLASSNIRSWEAKNENLDAVLLDAVQHVRTGRSDADIVAEMLLKLGLDLSIPIEEREIASNIVSVVGGGVLFLCFTQPIRTADVEPLADGIVEWHASLAPAGETTCLFRDSAFADDVAKTNLAAILEQHGLTNVRSL